MSFVLLGLLVLGLLPGGAQADEDFVAGSGRARASLFEIVPRTGGLTIPVSFGRALATYQGTAAEASSTAVKPRPPSQPSADSPRILGSLRFARGILDSECGDPGGGGGGGGRRGPSTSFPFTSTIEVGSDDEDSEAGRQASFASTPPGSPVQGAAQHQEVAATDAPLARAATTSGRLALTDLAELTGGRAEARSGLVDGRTRLSHAVVAVERLSLLGGLVTLEDLRWEATQRTGAGEGMEAAFTVGRVAVGGTPLPDLSPGGAPDPLAAVNTALAPTGLGLDPPRVEQRDGVARVTPLSLRMADSALGRQLVGPVLVALQPVRDPLVEGLLAISCDFGTVITVADVAAGVLSGSGGVSFDLGGVLATTEGARFENPLAGPIDDGLGALEPALPAAEPPAAPVLPGEETLPVPPTEVAPPLFYGPAPAFSAPAEAAPAEEVAAPVAARSPVGPTALGPTSRRLAGRRGGAALAVGAIGLAAVLALAAADALHLRRAAA